MNERRRGFRGTCLPGPEVEEGARGEGRGGDGVGGRGGREAGGARPRSPRAARR